MSYFTTDPLTGETVELFEPEFLAPVVGSINPPPTPPSGPTFMSDDWDEEVPEKLPTLLPVEGGIPLLYQGESHLLYGEGGTGKSWLCYKACAEEAAAGRISVIVDYESNRATVRARLKLLGVTKAQAGRIAYWRISGSLMSGDEGRCLAEFIAKHNAVLVVLDSVSKALAAAGLGENDPNEYIRWDNAVVVPLTLRGVTSLLIDHIGHQADVPGGGNRRAPRARGASSKAHQVSGAAYFFETQEHWTKDSNGRATVTCMKDREGTRKVGAVAANVVVTVGDGRVDMALHAPAAGANGSAPAPKRFTWYMEYLSKYLEGLAEPVSNSAVEAHVKAESRDRNMARSGLESLVREGFVVVEAGPRNAKLNRVVKPYRMAEDPLHAAAQAAPAAGGFGGGLAATNFGASDPF